LPSRLSEPPSRGSLIAVGFLPAADDHCER
jgi:hypothetical protein